MEKEINKEEEKSQDEFYKMGFHQGELKSNKKYKNMPENLKEEIDDIERTFKTVGKLGNYQERMTTQVFIDIRNQIDKAFNKIIGNYS